MSDPPAVLVHSEGEIVRILVDDGKANALTKEVLAGIAAGLDEAERRGCPVVLAGRPGRFSAGFDLGVMRSGPAASWPLVEAGARLAMRLAELPVPVVVGCTGHALAMGAVLLLAADLRIGAAGDWKIGLNEVAIGLPVPGFAIELARDRLSARHLTEATCLARVYDPETAVDAGWLDRLVPAEAVVDAAVTAAEEMVLLRRGAFSLTKAGLREPGVARARAAFVTDAELIHVAGARS